MSFAVGIITKPCEFTKPLGIIAKREFSLAACPAGILPLRLAGKAVIFYLFYLIEFIYKDGF
jgi:hypothetical protein